VFKIRVNLIFGTIKFVIKTVFKAVYKILSLFNLQLLLFVLLVGLVLFLTGVMTSSQAVRIIFAVSVCFSVVYALVMTIRKLLGLNKKKNKKFGNVEVVENKTDQEKETDLEQTKKESVRRDYAEPTREESSVEKYFREEEPRYPKYFNVKGRPGYVMAEYKDKYVLYYKTSSGMKKIRTDYK